MFMAGRAIWASMSNCTRRESDPKRKRPKFRFAAESGKQWANFLPSGARVNENSPGPRFYGLQYNSWMLPAPVSVCQTGRVGGRQGLQETARVMGWVSCLVGRLLSSFLGPEIFLFFSRWFSHILGSSGSITRIGWCSEEIQEKK